MIDIVLNKNLIEYGKEFGFSKVLYFKDLNIIEGGTDLINRKAVENKKLDILLSPEKGRGKDFLHSRDSGLNQVLCSLANKNEVAIGFSFSEILNSKNRSLLIGKIMQNIRLCRKYKVKMVFASFAKDKSEMRNAHDLLSLAKVLGMTPKEAINTLNFKKKEEKIKIIN